MDRVGVLAHHLWCVVLACRGDSLVLWWIVWFDPRVVVFGLSLLMAVVGCRIVCSVRLLIAKTCDGGIILSILRLLSLCDPRSFVLQYGPRPLHLPFGPAWPSYPSGARTCCSQKQLISGACIRHQSVTALQHVLCRRVHIVDRSALRPLVLEYRDLLGLALWPLFSGSCSLVLAVWFLFSSSCCVVFVLGLLLCGVSYKLHRSVRPASILHRRASLPIVFSLS